MQTLSKSYELCKFSCVGSIRGIPSGRGWAHHARSGSQSEHRIHFILPACAASYIIKWLTEQDIDWPIISYPVSRSQVSTCCLFSTRVKLNHWATTFNTWWSVDGLMNHSFFSFSPLWRVHQFPNRNIGKTYILQLISSLYFIFCLHLFSPPWGEKMNR